MAVTYKTATDGVSSERALVASKGPTKRTVKVSSKDPSVHRIRTTWSTTLALPKSISAKAPLQPTKTKMTNGGLKNSR